MVAGDSVDETLALANAQDFPGLKGMDLAKEVTTQESYSWTQALGNFIKAYQMLYLIVNCLIT